MAGFSDELKARLPQLMMSILAAKQGGPQALGAFQGGAHQAQLQAEQQAQQQALERQAQMDEERRQQQRDVSARAQRDDTRADEAAKYQRLQSALGTLDRFSTGVGETAMDPAAAENSILQRGAGLESAFGLPQGQLSSFVPNMAPAISSRKKKAAQDLYAQAEKTYGQEAMAGDSITLQTEAFGAVKPSELRALFSAPATTPAGAPAPIFAGKTTPPTPGSFEDYSTTTPERKAQIAADRKTYLQADDRTPAGPRDSGDPGPLETIIGPDGKAIRVSRKDAIGKPPAAGTEKASSGVQKRVLNFFNRAQQADKDLESMEADIQALGLPGQARLATMPNIAQSQLGQSYTAAQRAFTEARLRKDSGAAIPPHEFDSDRKTYFAQPGDSKSTLEQKRRARAAMLASLAFESGQALGEFVGDADEARSIVDGYKARSSGGAPAGGGGTPTKIGRFDVTVNP